MLEELLVGIFPAEVNHEGFVRGVVFNLLRHDTHSLISAKYCGIKQIVGSCRILGLPAEAVSPVGLGSKPLEPKDRLEIILELQLHFAIPVAFGLVWESSGELPGVKFLGFTGHAEAVGLERLSQTKPSVGDAIGLGQPILEKVS